MKILYGKELVETLREYADSVSKRMWIAVPYIGGNKAILKILGNTWNRKSKLSVKMLTDKDELKSSNLETINLFDACGEIKSLKSLHAKIYIIDDICIVTSANLTETAFSRRYEIGLLLDAVESKEVVRVFDKWWGSSKSITNRDLKEIQKRKSKTTEGGSSGGGYKKLWSLPESPSTHTYWIKPIGHAGHPVREDELFNDATKNLHFSKRKPKGVKLNDTLIVYGVGKSKILSIYKAISKPLLMSKNQIAKKPNLERWPWYIIGENITPRYGEDWMKYKFHYAKLGAKYLKMDSKNYLTKTNKGKTLGSLNFGNDKVKLSDGFARFIIKNVTRIDKKLSKKTVQQLP